MNISNESFSKYILYNEPLSKHTTFKVGGPAQYYIHAPLSDFVDVCANVMRYTKENNIPLFVLGGGANIVFADTGFKGIVLDTTANTMQPEQNENYLTFLSGTKSSDASCYARSLSLSGLEFLNGLPGTIGGAVRMNARCFEHSVSDKIVQVEILDETQKRICIPFNAPDWDYKKSPFQKDNIIILSAKFKLEQKDKTAITQEMDLFLQQRESKGHFRYPSAGSVFKNNRSLGKSAGQIIDELGLRGIQIGGAQIAPWHGNFIINLGGASSADIAALVTLAKENAQTKLGITLEPEIIFVPAKP
ncbi:MAG: UDP-N-acetylmuramate dehydrogenase [Termitinemataceae bacterium]|nr:MAG: UDP-N-acetylmuramate dehydrogenase [Termitinemataceae bacterium]